MFIKKKLPRIHYSIFNNLNNKSKGLPFTAEHFLKAVDDSSKRSRSILLLLIFSSLLIFMSFVNSLSTEYNWHRSKLEINKDIFKFILFPQKTVDTAFNYFGKTEMIFPVKSLSEYIFLNEKMNDGKISDSLIKIEGRLYDKKYPFHHYIMLQNPKIAPFFSPYYEERKHKYDEIGNAIIYVYNHNIVDKESLKEFVSKLEEAKIDHLDFVRVPILGISFHVNYLGIYGNLIILVLYVLLFFSLDRENINLKIAFKRGWTDMKHHHYYFYEYAAMLQVLSLPQKLFKSQKSKSWRTIFAYFALVLPAIICFIVILYDWLTLHKGMEINLRLTNWTIFWSGALFVFILISCRKIILLWTKMDGLWDDQTYQFNLEYILERIGECDEHLMPISDYYPNKLTTYEKEKLKKVLKPIVKYTWFMVVNEKINNRTLYSNMVTKISKLIKLRPSINILKVFIDEVFKTLEEDKFIDKILLGTVEEETHQTNKRDIEECWESLKKWYDAYGKKNVTRTFRKKFNSMLDQIKDRNYNLNHNNSDNYATV